MDTDYGRVFLAIGIVLCLTGQVWSVKLTHLSSIYLPYNITDSGPQYNLSTDAVEQVSFDAQEKIIYAAGDTIIHVIDGSNPSNLTLLFSQLVSGLDLSDVEVCGEVVFVSAENENNSQEGLVQVYRKYHRGDNKTLDLVTTVVVGPQPNMIHPRAKCSSLLVAVEAEAYFTEDEKSVDPEGAVVIIQWPVGSYETAPTVKTLNFQEYNSRVTELTATGVRFVYRENNNTFSADAEPEFIALDPDTDKAYVCLQENNGVAEVDLAAGKITQVYGLGYKQWGVFDASDKDAGIQLSYWPVRAWYQPDTIQFVQWQGRKLILSANEGNSKKHGNFRESIRGKQIKESDLGNEIPKVVKSWLKEDSQLGRLKLSRLDGLDGQGKYQALYTFGARSFSIWDAADKMRLLYDSGSDIENITAFHCPHAFNTEGNRLDHKSDSKGPETEALAVGQVGDRLFIFVGNENPGTIFVYSLGSDVTQPLFESIFCDGFPDNGKSLQEKYDAREIYALDPEELKFISAEQSPNGAPLLLVAGSESGTVSFLKVEV